MSHSKIPEEIAATICGLENVPRTLTGETQNPKENRPRRVLVLSSVFPSRVQPIHGIFVKERVKFVAQLPNMDVRVVSPVPYFPPIKCFKRWYPLSQIPRTEMVDGISVVRPRYFLPPKIGGYVHPRLMFRSVKRTVDRILREWDFDLIDAHFVYPEGVLATRLGRLYSKPVVVTCRGEDIERFPNKPLIGNQIRSALENTSRLVAVSRPIAKAIQACGVPAEKISLIPNGIDSDTFHPYDRMKSREELGLPSDRPIVLAVGYRLELKGFHILIHSLPRILERVPNALVVIVGGRARWGLDYTPQIENQIRSHGVESHVRLVGPRPPEELPKWYSAADVLSILSSREGSPNVLMEALACGLPAVATPVGGIPDLLEDSRLGILLPERSADAAAIGITNALSGNWDRNEIRHLMENRTWRQTARQVQEVFDQALGHCSSPEEDVS